VLYPTNRRRVRSYFYQRRSSSSGGDTAPDVPSDVVEAEAEE
jgi:hypothetical protein